MTGAFGTLGMVTVLCLPYLLLPQGSFSPFSLAWQLHQHGTSLAKATLSPTSLLGPTFLPAFSASTTQYGRFPKLYSCCFPCRWLCPCLESQDIPFKPGLKPLNQTSYTKPSGFQPQPFKVLSLFPALVFISMSSPLYPLPPHLLDSVFPRASWGCPTPWGLLCRARSWTMQARAEWL